MIRRAIIAGLVGGFVLTLTGFYLLVGLFAPIVIPGWQAPISNELLHGLLLMASAAVGLPVFFFGGSWAVRYGPATGWRQGLRVGLLSGATAGSGCYITLVLPINALAAYGQIIPHLPSLIVATPLPEDTLLRYVASFESFPLSLELELVLGIFALVWGVSGAIAGSRKGEYEKPEKSTLLSLIASGQHPRKWFADDESAIVVGLRTGIVIGLLALVTTSGWFYAGIAQDLEDFQSVIEGSHTSMVTGPVTEALAALSPLLIVALLGFGVAIMIMITNPRDRTRARATAILLAAVIIAVFLSSISLRIFYFNLGLAPFLLSQAIRENPEGVMELLLQLRRILNTFAAPTVLVATVFLAAWGVLLITILMGLLLGGIQAIVSIGLVPRFIKRPADKATIVHQEIKREPNEVLPNLHGISGNGSEIYNILAHISIRTYDSMLAISTLAAASHTLGNSSIKEVYIDAVDIMQNIISDHPQWRWSANLGTFHRTLYEILAARNLEQILVIEVPPERHPTSLPSRVVESMQNISRIISELKKSKRVVDLPTRLIFLENALTAIHEAQHFEADSTERFVDTGMTLPQRVATLKALDHLQGISLAAIKRLKGRADLEASLQNRICAYCAPLPLIWQVRNKGLNVAQEVRLRILPSQDYIVHEVQAEIDILPPGDEQLITLTVIPQKHVQRLRIEWEILYDDAIVDDRRLTFADVLEFSEAEQSVQRVFPIPYVTGTPLKSDDVFVGREDVFAFIYENLLGRNQNNVIILHGQRRTGKTSVMYRLGRMMADTHISVLIDMQGKPARSEEDFLYSIADDIVFALEDAEVKIDLPARSEFSGTPEFFFRSRFLRNLIPRLGDKKLLLMFDEFEELQRRVESGRLQPEIFQFLRNLMQHEENIDFVFAGTHRLEDLSADYWSILFNIAAYKPITFLEQVEIQRLMTEPVKEYGIEYDPLAVDRIMQVTAGHPYFTQLILHEMMVYHNEIERNYLTVADVNNVIERILERGEAHFKHIWAESSTEERDVLRGLAELGHSNSGAALHDLLTLLQKRGCQSKDSWQSALKSLVGREILTHSSNRTPRYCFLVDLIRLWIERTQPSL